MYLFWVGTAQSKARECKRQEEQSLCKTRRLSPPSDTAFPGYGSLALKEHTPYTPAWRCQEPSIIFCATADYIFQTMSTISPLRKLAIERFEGSECVIQNRPAGKTGFYSPRRERMTLLTIK